MDSTPLEKLILCVEDHDGMAAMIRNHLSRFSTKFAASYDEAVSLLDDHHFSFFLVDLNLKGDKTGIDVCRQIRHRGLQTPVFLMTASLELDQEDISQIGATGLIRKDHRFLTNLDAAIGNVLETA